MAGDGSFRLPSEVPDASPNVNLLRASALFKLRPARKLCARKGPCWARTIRIIGIDPGLRRTGWGIIESDGVRLSYVASGVITSPKDDDLAYRLRALFEGIGGVIASF